MNLKQTLDTLAQAIAHSVQLESTPFEQKLDAFKALTVYYNLELKRLKGQTEDDDPDEPTMEGLAAVIHGSGDKVNGTARTATRLRDRS